MSTERILVHKDVAEQFVEAFKKSVEKFYGSSGPSPILISAFGASKTRALVTDAVGKGAEVIYGDANAEEFTETRMRPVILGKITKEMDLYYTESFGPTVALYVFDNEEEAITLANDTEYGLSGAIFTENLATALRIARQYETG
jgi:acyl-CoA reductase-like NAD-dependent aldehyde dehydrogenase